MASEDGAVYINTKINTDGVEGGAEKVEQRIKDMVDKAEESVKGMADSLKSSSVEGLSPAPNADEEYAAICKQIEQAENDLNKAIERKERFLATGGDTSSQTFKGMEYDIENIKRVLGEAQEEKRELEESGALSSGDAGLDGIANSAKVADENIVKLAQELNTLKERQKELKAVGITEGYEEFDKNEKRIAEITQKMKEYAKETKNTSQNTRELGNEAKSAAGGGLSSLSSAIKKIAKLMAGAFAVHKLVSFGKESIALGSDLAEVQNVVDVTFGDLNGEINDFAKNAIKQFGLSETSAKQFSSTMGAMLKSMGFSERQAADMGMSIAGLAGDMASFYNLDAEEAFAKIRSGISGETEPLKQLGINLNVANLEQFALSQGITKSYNAMTQQEQALLRYNYLLNATSGAQGDFARTSDGWANQTRILSEQFNSLKATLGQGLINVLKPLLVSLNQLIGYLQQAADAFLHFTQVLTGADAAEQAVESNGAVAGSFNEITESVEEAEKAQNGYLSGLDEINKYSEPEAASGASSSAGSSGAVQTIVPEVDFSSAEKGSSIFDSIAKKIHGIVKQAKKLASVFSSGFKDGLGDISPKFDSIKSNIQGITQELSGMFSSPELSSSASNFAESVSRSFGQVAGSIASIGATIGQNLTGGISKFLESDGPKISQRLTKMFDVGSSLATLQGSLSQGLAEVFSVFGSETAQQVTANTISIFTDLFGGISEFLATNLLNIVSQFTGIFNEHKDEMSQAAAGTMEGLSNATDSIKESIGYLTGTMLPDLTTGFDSLMDTLSPLTDFLMGAFVSTWRDFINPAIDACATVISDLKDVAKDLWENVLVPLGAFLNEVLQPVIDVISYLLDQLWNNVLVPLGDFLIEVFLAAWDMIVAYYQNYLSPAIQRIISICKWLWEKVLSPIVNFLIRTFKPIFDSVFGSIKRIIESVKGVFKSLLNFITNIFKKDWEGAWNSVKDFFSNLWDSISEVVKVPINLIIGGINSLISGIVSGVNVIIRGLNALSFDVPKWVPGLGGKHFGFDIKELTAPQIPLLAKGAVIPPNAPFAAILGDQRSGTNIETPENLLRKIFREELGGKSNAGSVYRFVAQINRRTLFEEIIEEARLVRSQMGVNPFEVL